jgi:hypothetical protein
MSLGPIDLTGGPFLALYSALLAGTLLAGFITPRLMRPEGRAQSVNYEDHLAYLAGGASRFADAVVARMLSTGALMMAGKDAFAIGSREAAVTSAERGVIGLRTPFRWKTVELALGSHVEPIERQMVASGFVDDGCRSASHPTLGGPAVSDADSFRHHEMDHRLPARSPCRLSDGPADHNCGVRRHLRQGRSSHSGGAQRPCGRKAKRGPTEPCADKS